MTCLLEATSIRDSVRHDVALSGGIEGRAEALLKGLERTLSELGSRYEMGSAKTFNASGIGGATVVSRSMLACEHKQDGKQKSQTTTEGKLPLSRSNKRHMVVALEVGAFSDVTFLPLLYHVLPSAAF